MKYGCPSSVKAISQLDGRGPRLLELSDFCMETPRGGGAGKSFLGVAGDFGVVGIASVLLRFLRLLPSEDGCAPGRRLPMELVLRGI